MPTIRQILFIELLGGIGDLMIALPAIHALARSHPEAQMTVLTFAPGGELVEADPLIDRVLYAPPQGARRAVDALLERESFDLVVSDTTYEGIAEAIQQYQARSHPRPQIVPNLWRSPPAQQRVSDRFVSLLIDDGWVHRRGAQPSSTLYLTPAERAIARRALGTSERPVVFLCPDAGMPIKQWPLESFLALGRALQTHYGATVIVPVGDQPEQAQQIVRGMGGTAQVWKRGSLRIFAAAIATADLVIAADTGPAHIAAALDVPTITLFGPSWHQRYGHAAPHINVQGAPTCPERRIDNFTEQICWYSGECPYGWATCLEEISPFRVLHAAHALLQRQGYAPRPNSIALPAAPARPPLPLPAPPDWATVRNLLVMRLDNIGDVIMTSPALRALRAHWPTAQITLMASPAGALTAPLLPWVDEVWPWRVLWQDLGRLDFDPSREWQLLKALRKRQFDAAILFTSFNQSPHPAAYLCALAGIPLRLGESTEADPGTLTHTVPPAPPELHQVERNLRLIESVGVAVGDRRLTLQVPESAHQRLPDLLERSPSHSPVDAYILLNPWTTCPARNYDSQRFALAARQLSQISGLPVVVTGVDKDRDRAQPLLEILGDRALDRIGQTTLEELVALVAEASLVLTNNTSTMHIADAMETPNLVLFAGTELECQWQPRHSPSRLLRRPTPCSPCYAFTCPYDLDCLNIAPDAVVSAGLELLHPRLAGPVSPSLCGSIRCHPPSNGKL